MVGSRILFWRYRWSCGYHSGIWFRWFPWVNCVFLSIHIAYLFSPLSPLTAAAVVFGIMAGTLCNFATQLKFFAGYDDSLDVSVLLL